MHRLFSLIKVQVKMNLFAGMTYRTKKGRDLTLLVNVAVMAILAVSFLPIIIHSIYFMHENLAMLGMQHLIVQAGVVLSALVIMLFATLSVLETFYYSKDVDYLLPLPLKPTDLIVSKFSVALLNQYLLLALFYFPLMIVFGRLDGMGIAYYFLSFLLFFLIPIVPTVLLCVLLMIFMRLTSFGKNRDLIRAIFMFIIVIASSIGGAVIGAQASVTGGDFDLVAFMEAPLMRVLTAIFRPMMMGVDVILNPTTELLTFCLFLGITTLSFAVFIIVGKLLYLPTIAGYSDANNKKEALTAADLGNLSTGGSIFKTLLNREFKLIMRTPLFALNCFLMPLMMPVILVVSGIFGGGGMENILELVESLRTTGLVDNDMMASAIGIIFAVLYFMSSYNSTAISSFSREGKTLFTWKYLPIKLSEIIKAKLIIAIASNLLPMLLVTVGIILLLGISWFQVAALLVFTVVSLTFSSLLFLFFDLLSPRLNWDSEQQAMKGGMTQAILSIVNMLIAVGMGFAAWQISSIWVVVILGILMPTLGSLVILLMLQKKSANLFAKIG